MEVEKDVALRITSEISSAVEEILKKHGFTPPKIRTTYGDIYKVSFESTPETIDESGINVTSKEAVAYNRFYSSYDMPPGLLGTKFTAHTKFGADEFTFVGIATSRSKYPIVAKSSDGATVYFTKNYGKVIADAASLS